MAQKKTDRQATHRESQSPAAPTGDTHWLTRVFVSVVFGLMAATFVYETYALISEYRVDGLWFAIATFDAQNFVFFPIAGLAVLLAFWRPATVVVDGYARGRVRGGRPILVVGFVGAAVLSVHLAGTFAASDTRSLFEVSPEALVADDGAPGRPDALPRAPILQALEEVRIQSRLPEGLRGFRDRCDADQLNFSPIADEQKYCFVAGQNATVAECCRAKTQFKQAVAALHEASPSDMASLHRRVMPVKIFFLLNLVAIGLMLARRRKALRAHYGALMDRFAPAVLGGAGLMLIWPLMNAAYAVGFDMLLGDGAASAYRVSAPLYALGFAVWAMVLVFYHLRSYPDQTELVAQVIGVAVAGLGVLRYEQIIAYVGRTIGPGADVVSVTVFAAGVALAGYLVVLRGDGDEPEEGQR